VEGELFTLSNFTVDKIEELVGKMCSTNKGYKKCVRNFKSDSLKDGNKC
jgi:hypothetical protein